MRNRGVSKNDEQYKLMEREGGKGRTGKNQGDLCYQYDIMLIAYDKMSTTYSLSLSLSVNSKYAI